MTRQDLTRAPARRRPLGGALLAVTLVVAASSGPVAAQDSPAAADDPAALAAIPPRVRGVATWRRYVWTLERPLLDRITDDLEQARVEAPQPDPSRDFLLAYAHLAAGRREIGVEALERVRAAAPGFVPLLLLDGVLAVLDGRGGEAIDFLTAYVDRLREGEPDANFGRELLLLGVLHRGAEQYHLGRLEDAVADYEAALAIAAEAGRPPARQLVQRLALAYQRNEAHAKAENLVLGLLRRDPANAYHYFNMGVLKAEQLQFEEAREWYLRALRRDPRFLDAHAKLAAVCEKLDLLREMRTHLDAFVALVPYSDTDRRAEAAAGYAAYHWRMARRFDTEGREIERGEALQATIASCRTALSLHKYCLRAIEIAIKAAEPAGLSDEDTEFFRKRRDELRRADETAPDAFRRTLC